MVDIGDLREGVLIEDVVSTVREILKLDNIKLIGLGTNVTCYGGVIPDSRKLRHAYKVKMGYRKNL